VKDELLKWVERESDGSKMRFERPYNFRAGEGNLFLVVTNGDFRFNDRLIWTVQHLSRDFKVVVEDRTNLIGDVRVKINHHREAETTIRPAHVGDVPTKRWEYVGDVLPFQGFELTWDFTPPDWTLRTEVTPSPPRGP
jgi:hypothetical protein